MITRFSLLYWEYSATCLYP